MNAIQVEGKEVEEGKEKEEEEEETVSEMDVV